MKHPNAVPMLRYDEGFEKKIYKDHLGYTSIGIGQCLDKIDMPFEVARFWTNLIIDELDEQLATSSYVGITYTNMDENRKLAILNMSYQLGFYGVRKFTEMWKSLAQGDYGKAADEALDSKWAKEDTPERAERVASVLRTGKMSAYSL